LSKKVLLIPDAFFDGQSGALVANEVAELYSNKGYSVGVFIENSHLGSMPEYSYFNRMALTGFSNWNEQKYSIEYTETLKSFKPDLVFFIGAIVNKNLCYFKISKEAKVKVAVMLFIQDFFCNRLYANLKDGPCTRCLDGSYFNALKNKCNVDNLFGIFKLANNTIFRTQLKKLLKDVDYVIGSTYEQLDFYQKFGISKDKLLNYPLFFNSKRIDRLDIKMGGYFICSGQDRLEKGIHLLKNILPHSRKSKLKLVFSDQNSASNVISKYGLQPFIENGQLSVIGGIKWETGLDKLYSESRGVVNLSIWPTTTEYALLEALGLQKPVIAFDIGIHSEKIINGFNGFKVAISDFEKFGSFMDQVTLDDDLYNKLSVGAFELYKELTKKESFENCLETIIN